jgi:deoxyhypusine synthase
MAEKRQLKKSAGQAVAGYKPLKGSAAAARKQLLSRKVEQLKVSRGMKAADMVSAMRGMSVQARNIGLCAEVLDGVYRDKARPTVMLGLAGPLIAAGLRSVIRDLVAGGYVDVVVSTGAILYQDMYQARGHRHYHGQIDSDDTLLRDLHIDRIYDTYVDEEKFWATDQWCGHLADQLPPGNYSSRQFMDFAGSQLTDDASIVRTCHKLGVPIFCPAINDSSIGIGLTIHRHRCLTEGKPGIAIDSIQDNYELTQVTVQSPKTAAIYVAGGVPKNYINDSVVMAYIFGKECGHDYAIQLTTAIPLDGGLSGSTLGEAQSWGKIKKKANFAMAWVEPSVSLPMLAAYALDRFPAPARRHLKMRWDGEILKTLGIDGGKRK